MPGEQRSSIYVSQIKDGSLVSGGAQKKPLQPWMDLELV